MVKHRTTHPSMILPALLLGAMAMQADGAAQAADVDPRADALLKKMSDYVGGLKSFSADVHMIDQQMLADGFKLSLFRQGSFQIQRPNKLRLTRQGMVIDQVAYYNGKDLVVDGKTLGAYVTAPVTGDIDAALDKGAETLGGELPARDLVSVDAYTPLMEPVERGVYVGKVPMGKAVCHQLAFRTAEVDWQLWIQDGDTPVPCMYSITSRWLAGAPEFTVSFSNWKSNQKFPASTFEFKAPAGAKALTAEDFRAAVQAK